MSVMALSGFSGFQIRFEGISMSRSCRIEKQTGNE
ncbi:msl4234 [Mesorhizobium japonicum MAFF 303099]|uniref:Msl4234 protein n=1 Tax=Mesorhizobium japonicum (strain LMG 29417 / CECT 9101 / MAFF 303099) TaxID=266835 RepID=Q98EI0_RHILO|nr:msl4234 [Mesorhizobium japonicum MAFF 303099]